MTAGLWTKGENLLSLHEELEKGRQSVKAEAYSMSIGEVANLYKNEEIRIRPEFQRLFRWKAPQKARLIESILLGIPLPSIFVMQREDGVWEVIDGLQRISTILEFMGELRDENSGELLPASTMSKTEYLPSLDDLTFESEAEPDDPKKSTLSPSQRISFKRSKLDFKILLPESSSQAKFELFDRLNSGGTVTSAQEVRNCQLLMREPTMLKWLEGLKAAPAYTESLSLSERLYDQQYDLELVCRYLSLLNSPADELGDLESVDHFITTKTLDFADSLKFDREFQSSVFGSTFKLLSDSLGSDSFRRYDASKDKFLGGFSVSAFEAIAVGVAFNVEQWQAAGEGAKPRIVERVKELWSREEFRSKAKGGVRGTDRIASASPFARTFMVP